MHGSRPEATATAHPTMGLRTFLNSDAAMSNMLRCMLVGGLKLPQRTRTTLRADLSVPRDSLSVGNRYIIT